MLLKAKPNVTFSVSSGWATGRTFVSWLSLIFSDYYLLGIAIGGNLYDKKKTDTVYTVPQEALAAEPEVAQVGTMGQFHEFTKIAQAGPNTWQISLEGTWEHVSVHWYQVEYQLWTNCFMCWMPVANSGPKFSGNSTTTAVWSERPNPEPWPIHQDGASQSPNTCRYLTEPSEYF